ncbi:MAG TPA: isocitrate lyase/phosphoenolpyruvate mutase family protein [Acidimicrobiales bacterium]|nr:isocitrate lyase/phosphoenolpyruvate mutase family protein [Acidimicrobiales bacterium]
MPDSKAAVFLARHVPGEPLLQLNAFDVGSARILESLGFEAIATSSAGYAATLGLVDGSLGRDETLEHCRTIAASVDIPVAGDTENGFADDPADVAEFVLAAAATGLAGCSIEDWSGDATYDIGFATERIAAAAEAAHTGEQQLVLTGRADGGYHGTDDLDAVIRRLRAYGEAGADVLFAPGFGAVDDVRRIVGETGKPLNVLVNALIQDVHPSIDELAAAGAARISVGGSLAFVAYGALIDAARELKERGTSGYSEQLVAARDAIRPALR